MENRIITLSNGKKVANFSSPHSFTFTDGSVLPAVTNEEAERLKVTFIETHYLRGDVGLRFELTDDIRSEISKWMDIYYDPLEHIDVVFCPSPMLTALHNEGFNVLNSPFRSIRIEDRIKKLVSIDKQCI